MPKARKTHRKSPRKPKRYTVQLSKFVAAGVTTLVFANFAWQLGNKPSEILSFVMNGNQKNPTHTWRAYASDFKRHSTDILTPEFLAAMAQVESAGDSFASPDWKLNFEASILNIYKPASSSVGLMQFTEGTYDVAKKYCIHNHQVRTVGKWYDFKSCWFNWSYSRVSASDSIEMTSAYLDAMTRKLVQGKSFNQAALQTIAASIHLCGINKVRRSLRRNSLKVKGCGSHSLKSYIKKVRKYQKVFTRLKA